MRTTNHCSWPKLVLMLFTVTIFTVGCGETRKRAAKSGTNSVEEATEEEMVSEEVAEEEAQPETEIDDVGADDAQAGSTLSGGGILPTILHQRFHVEHRMVFIQIESAMNLYQGSNGHFPESHEEFMKVIIEDNSIALPELQGDWEYYYDAEDHTLKKIRIKD